MAMGACPGQIPMPCVPPALMVTATMVRACRYIYFIKRLLIKHTKSCLRKDVILEISFEGIQSKNRGRTPLSVYLLHSISIINIQMVTALVSKKLISLYSSWKFLANRYLSLVLFETLSSQSKLATVKIVCG